MYAGVFQILGRYWTAYGRLPALLRSFYLHVAIVLLALTFKTWVEPICAGSACTAWWDQSLGILPNLLGFTLGGFAIFVGFGDEKFRALLAEQDDPKKLNAYIQLCATFVHFIIVQVLALIVAVLAKAWWFYTPFADPIRAHLPALNLIGGAIGYGLFLYALVCVLAAALHVFRIASLYVEYQKKTQATGSTPPA